MIGNVFTVYELYAGEETLGSSTSARVQSLSSLCLVLNWSLAALMIGIHGMEPWLLREALNVLEGEGKVSAVWTDA